ncbi:cytochrome P450 4C1-like isoform X1 [Nymphalis io]|uniref:cytochrome P450 4C1-like isoform X1 n=1 Tax=Inachis io TaxID=171585 RepID=UPI0021676BEC|nr:cytochrome P450 4C1-like isoform X1 [Nymphalis io]
MMLLYFIMLIVFLSFYNIYRYYKKLNNSSSVPIIHDTFSLFKNRIYRINLIDLFKRIRIIGELTNERGGVTKFFFGPLAIHVVSSPKDASTVLSVCMEKMFLYSMIEPYVGCELIAAPLSVWKTNRRLIDHAFKQSVLDGYIEVFNKQSERLVAAMAEKVNKEFDFSEIITKKLLETVCQTMMGIDVNNKDVITDNYVKAINRVLQILVARFTRPWLMIDFIFYWTSLKKEQDECLKLMWNLSDQLVKLRKSEHIKRLKNKEKIHEKENRIQNSLDILIENTVTEDNQILSDLQIRQIIDNLLTAGFDTTSAQIIIVLINIGSHPDVQKKLYEEVISVMGDKDRLISKNDLYKFTYLKAVLKESIRLYPISPLVARKSTTNVQLTNYILPAGCNILVHLWAVNRNKNYWGPDADDFRPERWFDDSVPSHPAAFASFSLGRRNCIGKSYGMSFMKIVVANIVKKFILSADEKKLELEYAILLKPSSGNLIKIKPR